MKIAYLVNQYPKVSHSFIRREIEALEADGFEVLRYSVRRVDEPLVDEADAREQERTRVVLEAGGMAMLLAMGRMKLTRFGRYWRASMAALRMGRVSDRGVLRHIIYLGEACLLTKWLEQEGVQHLHAHFGTNSTSVARLVSMLTGIPYSFTVHGPEEFDKPTVISLGDKIKDAAFVAGVSSFGRSQLYRWCSHADWPKVQVVRCGVGERFLADEPTPVPGNKRLVCLGRLCEQKGQLLLVQACAALHEAGEDFELVLVGDGEMRPAVESLIAAKGLEEKVTITGWQNAEQVREWMQGSRAMVLASFAEGLPVAIMEALALGRPVVTTSIAGVPELVDTACGWVVPAGSVEALTGALRACLQADDATMNAMGRVGRERVEQRHAVGEAVKPLAALLREGTP